MFNSLIYQILSVSTRKQKLDTFTDEKVELMQKISFYQTINIGFFLVLVPFFAQLPDLELGLKELRINLNLIIIVVMQIFAQTLVSFFINYW